MIVATFLCMLLFAPPAAAPTVEPVTSVVPFPRGLALHDGTLYVLARGRVRGAGGVDAGLDDMAGTLFAVDPDGDDPTTNGVVVARPTDPPFHLLDRTMDPVDETRTDRPYCTLRFDPATQSFYLCAFSGIDGQGTAFRKNASDAVLRYDLRTRRWYEVARHAGGWDYAEAQPKGPNNCLVIGRWLYVVGKDNHMLVRHDLTPLRADPEGDAGPATLVFGDMLRLADGSTETVQGHSALAVRDGYLYVGFRTSGQIIRVRLDDDEPARPVVAEVVARFPAWDPIAGTSADITDIGFDPDGRLYVINAQPARIHRFRPDPTDVYDGGLSQPWVNLAETLGKPTLKAENLLVADDGSVFVTTGDPYGRDDGLGGVVYRVREG
ncbi:MAG: hypothetical protein AAGD32_11060 [Planctomycetota bacterium]